MAHVEYVYDDMRHKWTRKCYCENDQWDGLGRLRKQGNSLSIYIFHQREEDYKTARAITETQAIFLEPIQISQGSDNVIHYVKYPKRTTIWERERALVFWASQVEKSCFCRLGTGTLSQGTAGHPAWLQARLVIC